MKRTKGVGYNCGIRGSLCVLYIFSPRFLLVGEGISKSGGGWLAHSQSNQERFERKSSHLEEGEKGGGGLV